MSLRTRRGLALMVSTLIVAAVVGATVGASVATGAVVAVAPGARLGGVTPGVGAATVAAGAEVAPEWVGKKVFSFQPHCSHFFAPPHGLLTIPEGLSLETACFFPNMETAVNLVQDAAPLLGERVLVLGQGIIGLLTAALLSEFPLDCLLAVDLHPARRAVSQSIGVSAALDPASPDFRAEAMAYLKPGRI